MFAGQEGKEWEDSWLMQYRDDVVWAQASLKEFLLYMKHTGDKRSRSKERPSFSFCSRKNVPAFFSTERQQILSIWMWCNSLLSLFLFKHLQLLLKASRLQFFLTFRLLFHMFSCRTFLPSSPSTSFFVWSRVLAPLYLVLLTQWRHEKCTHFMLREVARVNTSTIRVWSGFYTKTSLFVLCAS